MIPIAVIIARLIVTVLVLLTAAPVAAAGSNTGSAAVVDARVARHGEDGTQLVVALTRPVDYRLSAASGADRIIIELPGVRLTAASAALAVPQGLISRMRATDTGSGGVRIVIDLSAPARVRDAYFMKAADRRDYQLVLNLVPRPAETSAAAPQLAEIGATRMPPPAAIAPPPAAKTVAAPPPAAKTVAAVATPARTLPKVVPVPVPRPTRTAERPAAPPAVQRIIVIDAGHGGKDPGAISPDGTYEKAITLAYAREIQRQLTAIGGYKVVLTRSRDVFIPLPDRVAKARKAGADLFLSIHADTMANPEVSGLSVYTVSERASDAEAAALADRENAVDRLGGINLAGQTAEAADILIDVLQRQTMNRSIDVASKLIGELRAATPVLPVKPHRFAGFVVLKAADVPSVLIELGFLSNAADAKRLRSPEHRRRVAVGIATAVDRYFGRMQAARSPS